MRYFSITQESGNEKRPEVKAWQTTPRPWECPVARQREKWTCELYAGFVRKVGVTTMRIQILREPLLGIDIPSGLDRLPEGGPSKGAPFLSLRCLMAGHCGTIHDGFPNERRKTVCFLARVMKASVAFTLFRASRTVPREPFSRWAPGGQRMSDAFFAISCFFCPKGIPFDRAGLFSPARVNR